MTTQTEAKFNYDELIKLDKGLVHSWIYTHPGIFEEEMEKIFHRGWVYIGHTSEIPNPGDYCQKWVGRESVIMCRDEDGQVHVFMNRCRHRANTVCQFEQGNANFFRCAYHGWTYRNNGQLVGVPFDTAYGDSFNKDDLGLTSLPRMEIYQGFVWGSLSPTGISLDDHMGEPAKRMLDLYCDASPEGEIELRHGVHKVVYYANWKFQGGDGYHPGFTHQASMQAMRAKRVGRSANRAFSGQGATQTSLNPASLSRDLGHGHYMLDSRGGRGHTLPDTPEYAAYRDALVQRLGEEYAAEVIRTNGDPHMVMMPNVHIVGPHVRVLRPLAADATEIYFYVAFRKGAPREMNIERLRAEEAFWGPAGGGNPDDVDMFERNQLGMRQEVNPWKLMSRGLERERSEEDGTIIGDMTDETTQRSQLRWWKEVMSQP